MSYIGIDIGTTGVKAVVFDEEGKSLSSAYHEYGLYKPNPGWFELKPDEVIDSCKAVIKESAGRLKAANSVKAVGIASQGEAFTLLDKNDKYLCSAMVSFDTRSSELVKTVIEKFGRGELYHITGHTAHTLFSLFKLLWIREYQPEIFAQISRFLCMGDLLRCYLTGNSVTSYNLAARTMMFDIRQKKWSDDIVNFIGLPDDVLPNPVPSGTSAGFIKPQAANELGLDKNVIVVTGGHDQCCGALGAGAFESGIAAYSLGTVECITPAFNQCVLDQTLMNSNLATYPHIVRDLYTTVAFCMTGGSGLKWFKDNFGQYENEYAKKTGQNVYDLLIEQVPDSPSDLLVLPHFTSTGTPYFDPSPLGAILGVKLTTKKGEVLRALLEGISFEMKLNLELLKSCGINISELRAFGGGTASPVWMQIKADIFNMPVSVVEVSEAGCMGAAMLAASGAGDIESINQCCESWVKVRKVYEPEEKHTSVYLNRFEVYKDLYEDLRSVRKKINNLQFCIDRNKDEKVE